MYKALLNLILALFLFSGMNVGAYPARHLHSHHHAPHGTSLENPHNALSAAKLVHEAPVFSFLVHESVKPLWTGYIDLDGAVFSVICRTVLQQNPRSDIYRLQTFRRLLFPFHFFG